MQIPQNVNLAPEQSYLGLSKPISPYEGDKSKGLALSGAANILESAVSSADMLVKEKISADVHAGVDARRDAEINALATLRDAATGTPQTTDPNSKSYDLFNQNKPTNDTPNGGEPPAALQGISSVANNLKAALVGGHIPLTYYRQQMDSFAKDMRSTYGPGYRPYVDEQFKQAGAGDTANEYMQALVGDLNKLGGKAQSDQERMSKRLEEANDKGMQGVPQLIEGRKRGIYDDNYVNRQLNVLSADHYKRQMAKESYELSEAQTKYESIKAEQDFGKESFSTTAISLGSIVGAVGIKSTADLAQRVAEARANPDMYKPQQYENWAQMVLQNRDSAYEGLLKKAQEPFGPDQRSYVERLGVGGLEKAKKIINDQLVTYDNVYNAFKSKDYGLAMNLATKTQHILETAEHDGFTDKDMGPINRAIAASNKQNGPAVAGILMQQALSNGVLPKFQGYIARKMLESTTEAEPGAKKQTLNDVLTEVQGSPIKDTELPKTFIKHVENIASKDLSDPAKTSLIKWAFNPDNRSSLNQIAPDRYDPATGQTIKGQAWMFQTMTSKPITDEIRRLSQSDPNLWRNYKNWAQESFGFQQLSTELKTVNDNIDQGVGMKWSNGHISLQDPRPTGVNIGYRGKFNPSAQAAIDRINGSLDNLKNVFAAETNDPKAVDGFLINTLNDLGINPNRKPPPGTVPPSKEVLEKMWSAIAATTIQGVKDLGKRIGTPNPKLGQPIDDKISNYVDEAKKVSLQDWLSNPAAGSAKEQSFEDRKQELIREEAKRSGTMTRSSTNAKWLDYINSSNNE